MIFIKKIKASIGDFLVYFKEKIILRKPLTILMYHSVSDAPDFFTVRPSDFEWQMEYLYENNYHIISFPEILEKLEKKQKLPSRSVIITFDDGYEDNYLTAFSILRRYNFPATIFLTTSRINDKDYTNKRNKKLPMLNWGQIQKMYKSGFIDFEPHTVSHPRLSQMTIKQARIEIEESRKEIEKRLGKECNLFAYPYGDYNNQVLELIKELGFRAALTTKKGFIKNNNQIFCLRRNSIDSLVGKLRFRLKI